MISMMLRLVFPPWQGVTNWATHLEWDGSERIRKFGCKRNEEGGRLSIKEGNENHDDRRDSLKRCMAWHVGQVYEVSGEEGSIVTQRCEGVHMEGFDPKGRGEVCLKEKSTNGIINCSYHSLRLALLLGGFWARESKLDAIFGKKGVESVIIDLPP
ncbi:hypothetical protein Tco_1314407 [Tanacetum coccineum]